MQDVKVYFNNIRSKISTKDIIICDIFLISIPDKFKTKFENNKQIMQSINYSNFILRKSHKENDFEMFMSSHGFSNFASSIAVFICENKKKTDTDIDIKFCFISKNLENFIYIYKELTFSPLYFSEIIEKLYDVEPHTQKKVKKVKN